jgi:alpha-amylase
MMASRKIRHCLPLWLLAALTLPVPSVYAQEAPVPAAPDARPWWKDAVFYEVFVRSFADAATGALACDGTGDLQGLIDRLDYLNDGDPSTTDDLGVTALWLMPIMPSPSYHGYDVLDYYAIEPDYGSLTEFKRLVEAAHARGMRVIIDLVLNHTSNAHPWYAEAADVGERYRDWYLWSDEKKDYQGPWGQQVWHPRDAHWYYGLFGPHMPDLNYRNPQVTKAAQAIARFWLEEIGVDGFRLDAIRHLIEEGEVQTNTDETHAWLQDFYAYYKEVKPDVMAVGEVWDRTEEVVRYIRDRELDLAFEFDIAGAFVEAVNRGDAALLRAQQVKSWENFPAGQYATFLTNHDQNRVMSQLGGHVDKAKIAATLLLTSPGVPFLYYGEEIGMTGMKPDVKIRTPMQWTAGAQAGFSDCPAWQEVNPGADTLNVDVQAADAGSLLSLYRRLIHLRQAHPALYRGAYMPVETGHDAVYAFLRTDPEETVMVVANLSDAPVTSYALGLEASPLSGSIQAEELLQGVDVVAPQPGASGGFADYRPLPSLAPRTGYVIRL